MVKKTSRMAILRWGVSILLWTVAIALWVHVIQGKTIPYLWENMSVRASVILPTPITNGQQAYEYCVLQEDAGLASQIDAGTSVPMDPVTLGPTATEVPVLPTEAPQPIFTPTFEPTATQPVYNELDGWQVTVTDIGKHKASNFHIMVIGVGFTDTAENEASLSELISGIEVNFAQVRVDFAYVQNPLNLNLKHADQAVDLANPKDYAALMAKIRKVHPADSLVIAISTPLYLGQANGWQFAMVTGTDPNSIRMASHETAHLLGLGDGYRTSYPDGYLPDSELFYLDAMPRMLSDALPKLKSMPPIYKVGTCKGKPLYTFYERSNNIMSDYNPQGPNSWGDSLFTPLQIQIMNDFVAALKRGN